MYRVLLELNSIKTVGKIYKRNEMKNIRPKKKEG